MDKREARSLLSVHRPGERATDPRVAEAEAMAAADPELARWWTEDQKLDDVIATKLAEVPVPGDLRRRLKQARSIPLPAAQWDWRKAALFAAAAIILLATFFGWQRGVFQMGASLADYRDEMVSFIKIDPPLELETNDFGRIKSFLQTSGAPSEANMSPAMQKLPLLGCRTLRFRGHDVALICFNQGNGRVAHLLVIDRAAIPELDAKRQYATLGEWTTVAWVTGDRAYLLAVQGDQNAAEQLVTDS
jgi:hypothetical protein